MKQNVWRKAEENKITRTNVWRKEAENKMTRHTMKQNVWRKEAENDMTMATTRTGVCGAIVEGKLISEARGRRTLERRRGERSSPHAAPERACGKAFSLTSRASNPLER